MPAPAPLPEVFQFFENLRNLARITPPELAFQVTTPGEIAMRKGAQIDYTIRWMGLPMKWRTLITDYAQPMSFVDEQARGPYTLWHHRHEFREVEGGDDDFGLRPLQTALRAAWTDRPRFNRRQATAPDLFLPAACHRRNAGDPGYPFYPPGDWHARKHSIITIENPSARRRAVLLKNRLLLFLNCFYGA